MNDIEIFTTLRPSDEPWAPDRIAALRANLFDTDKAAARSEDVGSEQAAPIVDAGVASAFLRQPRSWRVLVGVAAALTVVVVGLVVIGGRSNDTARVNAPTVASDATPNTVTVVRPQPTIGSESDITSATIRSGPIDPGMVESGKPVVTAIGDADVDEPSIGVLRIPHLGIVVDVLDGVGDDQLSVAVGHDPTTPQPGSLGNTVLAGHRTAHLAPFRDLDALRSGDEVEIDARDGSLLVYTVTDVTDIAGTSADTLTGHVEAPMLTLLTAPDQTGRPRTAVHAVLDTSRGLLLDPRSRPVSLPPIPSTGIDAGLSVGIGHAVTVSSRSDGARTCLAIDGSSAAPRTVCASREDGITLLVDHDPGSAGIYFVVAAGVSAIGDEHCSLVSGSSVVNVYGCLVGDYRGAVTITFTTPSVADPSG